MQVILVYFNLPASVPATLKGSRRMLVVETRFNPVSCRKRYSAMLASFKITVSQTLTCFVHFYLIQPQFI